MARVLLLLLAVLLAPASARAAPGDIFHALRAGSLDHVQKMLDKDPALVRARDSAHQSTPLHVAVARNRLDLAAALVARGADVNAGNETKQTPLHFAAQFGYPKAAEWLLARGADPNARTRYGVTPLRLAVANRQARVAEVLRRHGARE